MSPAVGFALVVILLLAAGEPGLRALAWLARGALSTLAGRT